MFQVPVGDAIRAMVMFGVNQGEESVLWRCLRCVLLSTPSVGWCGSFQLDAKCL